MTGDALVEVRTPTYRRPELLKRSLTSLLQQSWPGWRCIVLDDDPSGGLAREICTELADPRIFYRANPKNLGVGGNIDQAFSLNPLPGSTHACVLEDDNYYLRDNLCDNLKTMARSGVDVVLRNQLIEHAREPNEDAPVGPETTYDGQYVDGVASREELWATFFYSTAANNSSLFWKLGANLSFSTIAMTADPIFQERLRTLRIDRAVYIALQPQIVWRANTESTRPLAEGWKWHLEQVKSAGRERMLYQRLHAYLEAHRVDGLSWKNRFRTLDGFCERVFWRCGIRPELAASNLSFLDLQTVRAKREMARLVGLFVAEPVRYTIEEAGVEALK